MSNKLTTRCPWRKHVSNVQTLAIDDEEPMTVSGAINNLNSTRKNHHKTYAIQFHKSTTCSGTLLNEHGSIFDQFERPRPNKIYQSTDKNIAIMNGDAVFTPESHYVVDSAIPITKPKFYTCTFAIQFSQFQKEATFEHYYQNASMSLCLIPFDSCDLPPDTKIHTPALAPQVKNNDDHPNSCKLKIRMCANGKENAKLKQRKNHSPTCLRDSLRFKTCVSSFFNLWMYVSDIMHCFQNTMRDMDDKIFMTLPSFQ